MVWLFLMFILDFASFSAVVVFLGLLILFTDGYRRRLIGWLLVPSALLAVPGILMLVITIWAYFKFG